MNIQKIGEADWSKPPGRYSKESRQLERKAHLGVTTDKDGRQCVYIKQNPMCDEHMDLNDYLNAFDSEDIGKIEFYRFVQ